MADPMKLKTLKTIVEAQFQDKNQDDIYAQLDKSGVCCQSFAHFLFKAFPLFFFLISPLLAFLPGVILTEIIIIFMIIDFWFTKNVSGRRMVGLRWWVDFHNQQEQEWKFECRVNEQFVNQAASKVFWFTMYVCAIAWAILLLFNLFKFGLLNIAICGMGLGVVGFNLYSFYKCSKAQKQKVQELATNLGADMTKRLFDVSLVSSL